MCVCMCAVYLRKNVRDARAMVGYTQRKIEDYADIWSEKKNEERFGTENSSAEDRNPHHPPLLSLSSSSPIYLLSGLGVLLDSRDHYYCVRMCVCVRVCMSVCVRAHGNYQGSSPFCFSLIRFPTPEALQASTVLFMQKLNHTQNTHTYTYIHTHTHTHSTERCLAFNRP